MMVGRQVLLQVEKEAACIGDVVLDVQDLEVMDDRDNLAVRGVSFQVCAGQVLGVAGVQGNGQTELVQALTGLRSIEAGQIRILGVDITGASPRQILERGVAHVPEDRQKDGLVLSFPVSDNLVLNTYYQSPFARLGMLSSDSILATAEKGTRMFDVRTPSVMTPVSNLSGGNQQKVIIAREFSRPIRLLIASQPTRGLDVGSIEYIHRRIIDKRDEGCAVLLVSPELDEVMGLSDLIAVMYEGKIVSILPADQVTKEEVGLLMAGMENARKEVADADVA
jgi:simple sugar transport system ATP-binding protein